MKQLITRLDEGLHAQLRERAAAEGISVNRLVTEAIARLLSAGTDDEVTAVDRVRVRARLLGLAAPPTGATCDDSTREAAIAATAGVGPFAARYLEESRGPR